jgi:hypothetical protein
MENKMEKLSKAEEVKKQLEALAGRDLRILADQLFNIWFPQGRAYAYNDGNVCWRSILPIVPGKSCSDATLLDVSGANSTADNGRSSFRSARSSASRTPISSANPSTSSSLHAPQAHPSRRNHIYLSTATPMCRSRFILEMPTETLLQTSRSIGAAELSWSRSSL